jgi:MFS family permease
LASIGIFMTPLDGSIVSVALKSMGEGLHLSFNAAIWVRASYLLAISVLLIGRQRRLFRRDEVDRRTSPIGGMLSVVTLTPVPGDGDDGSG